MLRFLSTLLLSLTLASTASAQDDLFGTPSNVVRPSFLLGFHASADLPAADMAKRFGQSFRVGGSMQLRRKSNWQYGLKGDFIFGGDIKEAASLQNLRDAQGVYLDDNGVRTGVAVSERGYMLGVVAGKLLPFSKANPNRGILVQLGGGFIQHKISFYNQQDNLAQFRGEYKKGYDRLTNGLYLEPFAGYQYFSENGLVNFHIGVGAMVGFTGGRRDYQFDTRMSGKDSRLDVLLGLRAGWTFSFFRKRSEELFFE